MNTVPSLKQKLNDQFKIIASIRDERVLRMKVKDLIYMMLSPIYKYTCAHPSRYHVINQKNMQMVYGMHMAVKIRELAEAYNQDLKSEFVTVFLALCMEYFNLTQTTNKREKIRIHGRIDKISDKIHDFKIDHDQWSAQIAIIMLQNHAVVMLTEAFIMAMQ